jgi:hypothetical protein
MDTWVYRNRCAKVTSAVVPLVIAANGARRGPDSDLSVPHGFTVREANRCSGEHVAELRQKKNATPFRRTRAA